MNFKLRQLLRCLLVWGKTWEKDEKKYQFCYPSGFLKFAQRMLGIMDVEEALWIIVGIVTLYPRLWCLEQSSLIGDTKSNFKFELTIIKAAVELKNPELVQKLNSLGVSIEQLIYDSVTSLYSDMFHSETLYRIWDMLIFYLNASETKENKIWPVQVITAPAIMIFQLRERKFMEAQTVEQVVAEFRNGCGISYNPDEIIKSVDSVIKEVFVENMATGGFFGSTVSEIDAKRRQKQQELDKAVEKWKNKNEAVHKFLNLGSKGVVKEDKIDLSYAKWRQNILPTLIA